MLLRTLVTNYLREQARQRLQDIARESFSQMSPQDREAAATPQDVAIVFGTGVEAGGLVDLLAERVTMSFVTGVEHTGELSGRRVVLVESGTGPMAAAAATNEAISLHQVKWVLAAGFSVAVDPQMKRGHFLMAEEISDVHGQHVAVDLHVRRESLAATPAVHVGRLLSVEHTLKSPEERRRVGHNHGALASDMESLAIAQAAHAHRVPYLCVRIITEEVDDELPQDLERLLDQKSLPAKLGAAAGALWKQPSRIKDLWQLKEDAIKASDRLGKFLAGVVGNLPATTSQGE